MRCENYQRFSQIVLCRSTTDLENLRASLGDDTTALAVALRDQIRARVHVYKMKPVDLPNIGSDKPEEAVARLLIELREVVGAPLPSKPPPPVPYPARALHPAPTLAAVAFEMKHIEAISAALNEIVAIAPEGSFQAPRRRAGLVALPRPRPKSAKRKREPTAAEAALVGVEFEEDFIDWKVLAVEWSGEMEAVLVWYYDVDMAKEAGVNEDEMNEARTGGLSLGPLESSSVAEVKKWIKEAARRP